MSNTGDGRTHATGLRINGPHCTRCGRPTAVRQKFSTGRIEPLATTTCCWGGVCHGYVVTQPWTSRRDPARTVWACCIGLAERHLGGPAWIDPASPRTETAR